MRRPRWRSRGYILLGVYALLAAALVGLNVFSMRAVTQSAHTTRYVQSTQALDLARAGVEQFREDLYRFLHDRVYLGTANANASIAMGWLDQLETAAGGGALEDPVFDPYDDPADLNPPVRKLPLSSTYLPVPAPPGMSFTVTLASGNAVVAPDGPDADTAPDSPTCAGQVACDVTVRSTATVSGVTRTVQATLRFSLRASEAFKYLYFINNYGYFSGNPARHDIKIHGDLRANGDLNVAYIDWLHGDLYGAANPEAVNPNTGLPSTGAVSATSVGGLNASNYLEYRQQGFGRPTDPYRLDTPLDPTLHPYDRDDPSKGPFSGYKGSIGQHPAGVPIEMPVMGDLAMYRYLANTYRNKEGGTGSLLRYWDDGPDRTPGTTDDKYVTITGVYDGVGDSYQQNNSTWATPQPLSPHGPDGVQGTADDGTLIIGTRYFCGGGGGHRPCGSSVSIDGPVVVPGDAIVTGMTQRGQGVIYAGRNVHITGTIWRTDSEIEFFPSVLKCNRSWGVEYRVDCWDKTVTGLQSKAIIDPDLNVVETRARNECR